MKPRNAIILCQTIAMKKVAVLLISLVFGSSVSAQEKVFNALDSAYYYYLKKDLKKSSYFYDLAYLVQKKPQSNYDTYRAAIASAYLGNMENAKYYIKRSGEIFYDYSGYYEFPSYDAFINAPIHYQIKELREWKSFIAVLKLKADSADIAVKNINARLEDPSERANDSLLANADHWKNMSKNESVDGMIKKIKSFNAFQKVKKTDCWTLYHIKVNDTLTVPFLVYIPRNYTGKQKIPLYVYLHGAIINKTKFANPAWIEAGSEIKIMDRAKAQNAFIIYPFGKKTFGWLYQQEAFETIIREIRMVKSLYNIDDNKVYIGGHSNGGSGAFWYAANKPSMFASFFGLNYLPRNYFGNTSFTNLKNSSTFYGVSGSNDTTFPFVTVNSIYQYAKDNGANWKNFVKVGNHGLPVSTPDSIDFIFDTLAMKTRNPFPKLINWETDDIRNGRNAWLEIVELDTLAEKASWHQALNPPITQGGKTAVVNFNLHRSGAVKARALENTITIETSRVKRIKLYISADMFDLKKKVRLIINGKEYLNVKLRADRETIVREFLNTKDRTFIVSTVIDLTLD